MNRRNMLAIANVNRLLPLFLVANAISLVYVTIARYGEEEVQTDYREVIPDYDRRR